MFKKIILAGVGASFSLSVAAGQSIYDIDLPLAWGSIITLSGGPSWGTAGQNQYLYPSPLPMYNFYTYNSPTSTMANAEIFFGLQRPILPYMLGELGLGVAGVSDAKVTGTVNVNGFPDLYGYEYKVNHVRIELKGKLIGNTCQPVQPYVSGSLGVGFNNSHDYRNGYIDPNLYLPPWFESNTTVAFAYSLGAGVQTMVSKHWQVGVGYEFADLGKSFLGDDNATLVTGPRLTHMYNHQLLFSLSFLYT
ncbi:outer membrane protein [Legionella shakespearei]|uniref:Outer membrane protein beta-barrel domain-containing protein n=1 Tax=Legionella shakespearei DSM 23087 TaxID=1122169 RepID=A0A0W0Z035_9GAMM|nr:outer membrane beta-barrel protein [Legionella shakespearei]KTD62489.1 hypothetical protein Lsha_1189 [Legionella shakespearei DSM 23087]